MKNEANERERQPHKLLSPCLLTKPRIYEALMFRALHLEKVINRVISAFAFSR